MTVPLQSIQALLAVGSRTICWTPGRSVVAEGFWEKKMGNRDARIKDDSLDLSERSGGRQTKCRTSAAEVPI